MNMIGARQTRSARAKLYEKTHRNPRFSLEKLKTTKTWHNSSELVKTTRYLMVFELREVCFAIFVALILVVLKARARAHGRF
jgi:hypothetical protein